ncbi:GNAT family N-acetyltransferase [Paucihalobacter sp.]|uniref:GNAT family N-acetyltransferase n=1 Tax=Paucihalobacter sp. TaxID=2850405 RepID=UPI002FDFDE0B
MLNIQTKEFNHLSLQELYAILQLRSEIFVVEQNCVYQDLDGKDEAALHILGFKHKKLVAYTRVFEPGYYFKEASIGRVVVGQNERKFGYGYDIMMASIQVVQIHFKTSNIRISAQCYLKRFYNNLNFVEDGVAYLEDGIPHISMLFKP